MLVVKATASTVFFYFFFSEAWFGSRTLKAKRLIQRLWYKTQRVLGGEVVGVDLGWKFDGNKPWLCTAHSAH